MESAAASRREVGKLRQGRAIRFFGGQVPVRMIIAIAIFVAAFMVIWMALWFAIGMLGLVFGMLPAIAAGLLAVKLYGDRLDSA